MKESVIVKEALIPKMVVPLVRWMISTLWFVDVITWKYMYRDLFLQRKTVSCLAFGKDAIPLFKYIDDKFRYLSSKCYIYIS